MKLFGTLLALVLLSGVTAHAVDDFKSALEGVTTAQQALPLAEKYVNSHPKALDIEMAKLVLGQLYGMNGDHEKAVALLETSYAALAKGAQGDLQSGFSVTSNLVTSLLGLGDKAKATAAVARLKTDFKDHPELAQAANAIANIEGKLNQPAKGDVMEVKFADLDGHPVDLAALKGKVVLVDFWATWCGPCVGELPNVLKAYETYHDKGFEVIGISLDEEEKTLREFVKARKIPWAQGFDGKGWQSGLAVKYGIHSIPATFLIGKDGKVAATGLRGEALAARLAELLK